MHILHIALIAALVIAALFVLIVVGAFLFLADEESEGGNPFQ